MLNLKNTLDGYLKNVEVVGNTVQDANNLANIRSVGDKVDGQELYKIDVVSCGKNIWKAVVPKKSEFVSGLFQPSYYGTYIVGLKPNTQYTIHVNNPTIPQGQWVVLNVRDTSLREVLNQDNTGQSGNNNSYRISIISDELGRIGISLYLHNTQSQEHWDTFYNLDIQLEEGTQATPYEPYQEQKLEILSPVQLEKVGDVADRIICKDGVWGVEKNVEKLCLEPINWSDYRVNVHVGAPTMTFMKTLSGKTTVNETYICNRFLNSGVLDVQTEGIQCLASNYIYISIFRSRLETEDVDGFMKWMNNNDVYVLKNSINPQFIPLPHDQQVKLRTFAGQTNIAFLTEIPGQIKAQVPKSLGATVNTHTEQIADLHNSLERVKKLEETTVSTVETESSFTTVNETSNGYFEGVKLEGKTLVDRTDIFNKVNPIGVGVYQKTNNSLIVDYSKCGEIDKARSLDETNVFKSGQIYTIIIDILQNTLNQKVEFYPMIWDFATVISGTQYVSVGEIGRKIFVIKANKDYSLKLAYASPGYATQGVTGLIEFKDIMVLDGDYTNKELPSYFEGLMSVGQDVEEVSVESVSSGNLIDLSRIVVGKYIATSNKDVEHGTSFYCDKYVKVYPGVKYQLIASDNSKQVGRVSCYGKNGNYISTTEYATNTPIYFDSTVDTIRLSFFDRLHLKDMLYFGTNSNYIGQLIKQDKKPLLYYNPTTETWEKPILREWDSIEKHSDGKYYYHKRSNEMILNGSKNAWNIRTDREMEDTQLFTCNIGGDFVTNGNDINLISDKFNSTIDTFAKNIEGFYRINGYIYLRILKSKLSTQNVAGFKAWLKANPTTVVYQLAQEEIYECTNIDLMTYSGETNYIINSGAISPKSLLKVHNNISNVVKILQEKVSLLENTFIAGLRSVLSGDMYSLATILYPEDFEQNDNTEQDIMVIPE